MKFSVTLFIAFFALISVQAQTYTAPKVNTLPVFDGNGNDAVWNDAIWQNIDQIWIPYNNILPSAFTTESGTQILGGSSDFSARYKIIWSQVDNVIVFLVEIHDDIFVDGYTKPNGNYPNFDILEFFIDENKSGGNHLFDINGNNAENAFAYHIAVNNSGLNQVANTMTGAMDLFGSTYGNIVDYQSHFSNFSFKNTGNGNYVYELALKVYKDNYDNSNPTASLKTLNVNDNMGLSIAYCDNDQNDLLRDSFIASASVTGFNNNNSYIDASIFGGLILGPAIVLNTKENTKIDVKLLPNPLKNDVTIVIPNNLIIDNTFFKLYNVSGKEIKNEKIIDYKSTFNYSEITNGIYFYKILNDNIVIKDGKLIKD
jgi:Carbohydrate family 9 binding domain-like/Secretion system C-terminal sorting domain